MNNMTNSNRKKSKMNPCYSGWHSFCLYVLCLVTVLSGCRTTAVITPTAALPARHSVRSDQLLVLSNFKVPRDHVLIRNLEELRENVTKTLGLSVQEDDVVVYLFSDKKAYEKYLKLMYPELPSRRAYFVGSAKELAVFTYMGDRVQEDLRHEFTHGLLHASSRKVPLWLDEGLAEYFETPDKTPGMLKTKYMQKLSFALEKGWRPDINRLENLDNFASMSRDDYQEAWAWVHFMIHHSPETHEVLTQYLDDLKTKSKPELISKRLASVIPHYQERLTAYMANMNTTAISQAGYIAQQEEETAIVLPEDQ